MTGVPNYKDPGFYKYGYQTLRATAIIAGFLIGRSSPSGIIPALQAVESQQPPNTQVATHISKSPGKTSPTKHEKSSAARTGAYYTSGTPYLSESWRLEYESNR